MSTSIALEEGIVVGILYIKVIKKNIISNLIERKEREVDKIFTSKTLAYLIIVFLSL